ncbi:hypothetical protein MVEN_00080100 [Mycena venus]|uniref:Uncharacterized protein n=1 Tax=Mycena venus TaxID=2733690 RepID=A0A8H7DHA2_9AGAR|nr:hypothetical protein MVEN_00080100 [Mycena venus]
MQLIGPLRVPWNLVKTRLQFANVMKFIGSLWDLTSRRVSLPEEKWFKFLGHVQFMLTCIEDCVGLSLQDIQKIHGSLMHICFVYCEGSSHLPVISNFMSHYNGNEFICRHGFNALTKTLLWWK